MYKFIDIIILVKYVVQRVNIILLMTLQGILVEKGITSKFEIRERLVLRLLMGSIPRSGVKCGLSLLVLFSAPRGFPSPQKPKFDLIVLIVNLIYSIPN